MVGGEEKEVTRRLTYMSYEKKSPHLSLFIKEILYLCAFITNIKIININNDEKRRTDF